MKQARLAISFLDQRRVFAFTLALCLLLGAVVSTVIPGPAMAREFPAPGRLSYPPLKFSPPAPQFFRLANGLRVYFLENRDLPVIKATLLINAGAVYDEKGKEGTAELTAALMRTGGTEQMAPRLLDETLSSLAAVIEPAAGLEQVQWSLFSLRKEFPRVWEIFSRILRTPRFDMERLRLLKELKSEEIRRLADDPQQWAFKEFNRLIYAGNPRGRLPTVSGLKSISREDLIACRRLYYTPDNMILAISGDIGREEVERMVRDSFGDWPAGSGIETITPPFPPFMPGKYYLVKETPQTVTVIGRPGPPKRAAAYFAFTILDHVLGSGGFRSRIFQQVRTDRGLAYATGSFYRARVDYGVFGAYAMTRSETAAETLRVIQDLVREAGRRGLRRDETERAKNSILNSFIFSFATPHQLVGHRASLAFDSLPEDFLWQYRERIELLTDAEIKSTAAAWLDFDQALILMLGSAAGYEQVKNKYPDFKMIKVNYD